MSGLSEIIEWTQKEIDLEQFENAGEAFQFISDIFVNDNRNDLDSILLNQKSEYLEFLRGEIEFIGGLEEPTLETRILQGIEALFG